MMCPLQCEPTAQDTQEHLFTCKEILNQTEQLNVHIEIEHDDIYGTVDQQRLATARYIQLDEIRQQLLSDL